MLVSLVGLPAVGKSAIGRRLARRLAVPFQDCDALLEARLGKSIREVFESEGEQRFRDAEAALLAELASGSEEGVLATGGGIVLRPDNRQMLRDRTFCIYLRARPDDLRHRLRNDAKRPLLQVADPVARLRELSAEREPLYREAASAVVETHGLSFERLLRAVVAAIPALSSPSPAEERR